jgi:hypothetical protein
MRATSVFGADSRQRMAIAPATSCQSTGGPFRGMPKPPWRAPKLGRKKRSGSRWARATLSANA